jgi:hypothetical protein
MHQQIRVAPVRSPADLIALLQVLKDGNVNIEAAGGSDIEGKGEFAFAVKDGEEANAMAVLKEGRYKPVILDVHHCALTDEPGQLLECIQQTAEKNQLAGRWIRDIAVGVPDEEGRIQVQIYWAGRTEEQALPEGQVG